MVRFKNIEQITNLMSRPDRIRNISIIAHVDHGKSTLTDSLVSRAGLIAANEAGDKTFTDNREDEKERGITIKATALSIPVVFPANREEFADEEDMYVVNLIDCPGHVDFSGEVTAALRLTDGAVVVVDCIEGVCVQTEVVLRQALEERIKPVLFLNKLDRMFGELNSESEEIYQSLCRTIESVNALISLFSDSDFKEAADFQADPLVGNVAFGSGLYGWGFTIEAFADMYSRKTGQPKDKWRNRLWGDHFYNAETKKWAKAKGPGFERGFCAFILDPIRKTLQNLQDGDLDTALKKLQKVEVVVDASWEKKIRSLTVKREITRTFMSKWIPVSEALLQLVVKQIPSPNVSQKYKIPAIYSGPMDDNFALDMQACKTDSAELMAFVAKMVPNEDATRFFGLTRVFSGELVRGEKLTVISADAKHSSAVAQRLFIVIGHQVLSVDRIPAGMLVGVSGLEKCLTRSGTLCSHQEAHMFRGMHFSVSSVVRQAVSTVSGKDSKKLVEALRKIEKSDPMVEVFIDDKTGECIIAGVGELHLEICLSDLQKFLDGVELKVSNPVVPFAETISTESDFLCITKSTNKHNHLMATVSKVSEEQIKILEDPFGPVKGETRDKKLWAVNGTNLLMDNSKGVQGLNQIKPSIVKAFEEFSGGVLCEEPVRGMQVDLVDFKIHSDNAHRGFNQIAPAAKALFQACQMSGKPRLMEPMYEVSIRVPRDQLSGVYVCLSKRKAILLKTEEIGTNGLFFNIVAHLAVRESFGFTGQLRAETSGQAFPQMSFSHWHLVEGDPFEAGTLANKLVKEVRQRKRLPESLPKLEDFHTKL